MEVECHICHETYSHQLEACSICGKPTCKRCLAYRDDVEELFWARYVSLHVGPLCSPCESEYKSWVNKEYCRVCFERAVWAVDYEFMDAEATLSHLLDEYKCEQDKQYKNGKTPTTQF